MRYYSIALIHDVFVDDVERLRMCLKTASVRGAQLAVLPELPLNSWSMATKKSMTVDAEEVHGMRWRQQEKAAAHAGIALLGGVIVRDPTTQRRYNTALLMDATGTTVATYEKIHLPQEPGFWEACHYNAGRHPPRVTDTLGPVVGIQICSDAHRMVGAHILAAQGVQMIIVPRATEAATFARWRMVFRAMALTCASYVITVNRPRPEGDALIGGPSMVVGPQGEVLLETEDLVSICTVDLEAVSQARRGYPGYLDYAASVYAAGWYEHQYQGTEE